MENYKSVKTCPTKENIVPTVLRRLSVTKNLNSSNPPYDFILEPVLKELEHIGSNNGLATAMKWQGRS